MKTKKKMLSVICLFMLLLTSACGQPTVPVDNVQPTKEVTAPVQEPVE